MGIEPTTNRFYSHTCAPAPRLASPIQKYTYMYMRKVTFYTKFALSTPLGIFG